MLSPNFGFAIKKYIVDFLLLKVCKWVFTKREYNEITEIGFSKLKSQMFTSLTLECFWKKKIEKEMN